MNEPTPDQLLDALVGEADPVRGDPAPSSADIDAGLQRLLAVASHRELPHARLGLPDRRTLVSEAGLRLNIAGERAIGVVAGRGRVVSRTRRRLVAGTATGVAASATAALLLLGTTATPPAFAVTRHADGHVSLTINRLSGVAGANRELAADGVGEHVVALSADQTVPQGCLASAVPVTTMSLGPGGPPSPSSLRVAAAQAQADGNSSAAQQLNAMANGTYKAPSTTGNTGSGTGNAGGGEVAICPTGNTGYTGNTGAG